MCLILSRDNVTNIDVLWGAFLRFFPLSFVKFGFLIAEILFLKLFWNDELVDCLTIADRVLILLFLGQLDRPLMEQELIFHMVLESHYNVVPNCAESVLILPHLRHNTSVDVSVEMPALDIVHVASLDWDGEANRDGSPGVIVCRVSK